VLGEAVAGLGGGGLYGRKKRRGGNPHGTRNRLLGGHLEVRLFQEEWAATVVGVEEKTTTTGPLGGFKRQKDHWGKGKISPHAYQKKEEKTVAHQVQEVGWGGGKKKTRKRKGGGG